MIELFIYVLVALWSYYYLSEQEPTLFGKASLPWIIVAISVSPILLIIYLIIFRMND